MHADVKSPLVLACILVTALAFHPTPGAATSEHLVNCDVHAGPCTSRLADSKVTLDIRPKPVRAMQDLTFTVTVGGETPIGDPHIDLGMPGMDMGRNRVRLRSVGDRVFQGTGVIVRCPSGRRTWKATVAVPDIGATEFVFDVIY